MTNFLKDIKYKIIKNVVPEQLCDFISEYFLLREKVAGTLVENKAIPPFDYPEIKKLDYTRLRRYSSYIPGNSLFNHCVPRRVTI